MAQLFLTRASMWWSLFNAVLSFIRSFKNTQTVYNIIFFKDDQLVSSGWELFIGETMKEKNAKTFTK